MPYDVRKADDEDIADEMGSTTADFASRWIGKRKARMRSISRGTSGTRIKKLDPILQVSAYNGGETVNKIIELP
jgi:hypothetical protein